MDKYKVDFSWKVVKDNGDETTIDSHHAEFPCAVQTLDQLSIAWESYKQALMALIKLKTAYQEERIREIESPKP